MSTIRHAFVITVFLFAFANISVASDRATPFLVGETIDPGTASQPCGPLDANCFPSVSNAEGWLYSTGVNGTLSASSSPTFGYVTATTTATSSFAGGVSANQLYVNDATSTLANLGVSYALTSNISTNLKYYNIALWGDSLTYYLYNTFILNTYLPTYNIYNGGVRGDTSTQIYNRMIPDFFRHNYTTVIWAGYNDHNSVSTVESNISAMVNSLGHNNFLVLTVLTGASSPTGTSDYTNTITINNWIAATYPNNYYDIRSYLVSQYDPNSPQDVTDHGNDIVPTSLRVDGIHLTTAGYNIVAQKISSFIQGHFPTPVNSVVSLNDAKSIFTSPLVSGQLDVQGTTTTDTPVYGQEFLSSSGWTSTGWTGSQASGWAHTTGNTSPLSQSTAAVSGTLYQIDYTVTNRTAGSFTLSFGGVSASNVTATGLFSISSSGSLGPITSTTDNLVITPTTDFDGTIAISIKPIAGISQPVVRLLSSDQTGQIEIRSSTSSNGYNIFIGNGSGEYNTTGYANSSYGTNSLMSNTTGSNNSAFGESALHSNLTGNFNTASGYTSMFSNTSGYYNVAYGARTLYSNTTGYQNSATGFNSLFANTTGYYNSGFGYNSLSANTSGYGNTAMGVSSLTSNTTGTYNTTIGYNSLSANTSGGNNAALGISSMAGNTTGTGNTAVGSSAGRYITDGVTTNKTSSNSVYIGYNSRSLASGDTNEIVIGATATGLGSNSITLGNSSITKTAIYGNVGIASSSPFARLSITGNAGDNSNILAISTSTSAYATTTVLTMASDGTLSLNTPGATSTITGNLYVNGTLRGTNVYSGDLVFANNFRFTESQSLDNTDSLTLQNQSGMPVLNIDQNGNLNIRGDLCSNSVNCFGKSLDTLSENVSALASSTAQQQALTIFNLDKRINSYSSTTDAIILQLSNRVRDLEMFSSTTAITTADMLSSDPPFIVKVSDAVKSVFQKAGDFVFDTITAVEARFTRVQSKSLSTDILCVGQTCLTETELKSLLQNSHITQPTPNETDSTQSNQQMTASVTDSISMSPTSTGSEATSTATSTSSDVSVATSTQSVGDDASQSSTTIFATSTVVIAPVALPASTTLNIQDSQTSLANTNAASSSDITEHSDNDVASSSASDAETTVIRNEAP